MNRPEDEDRYVELVQEARRRRGLDPLPTVMIPGDVRGFIREMEASK
jgi:hypothetical protein